MKILYLIKSREFPYHKEIIKDFLVHVPGEVYDLSEGDPDLIYKDMETLNPDVVITFDYTGYEFRTISDTLSLNNMYAKMAHILFHKASYYGRKLYDRQNLSMFTFLPKGGNIEACREQYREVPNISEFGEFYYRASNEREHSINQDTVTNWWEQFKKEAMI